MAHHRQYLAEVALDAFSSSAPLLLWTGSTTELLQSHLGVLINKTLGTVRSRRCEYRLRSKATPAIAASFPHLRRESRGELLLSHSYLNWERAAALGQCEYLIQIGIRLGALVRSLHKERTAPARGTTPQKQTPTADARHGDQHRRMAKYARSGTAAGSTAAGHCSSGTYPRASGPKQGAFFREAPQ